MEKAYDFGELMGRLKDKGMDVAEDAAMLAVEEILVWLKDSAKASENVYDDILIAVVPMFEAEIKKMVDKIDGKEG